MKRNELSNAAQQLRPHSKYQNRPQPPKKSSSSVTPASAATKLGSTAGQVSPCIVLPQPMVLSPTGSTVQLPPPQEKASLESTQRPGKPSQALASTSEPRGGRDVYENASSKTKPWAETPNTLQQYLEEIPQLFRKEKRASNEGQRNIRNLLQ